MDGHLKTICDLILVQEKKKWRKAKPYFPGPVQNPRHESVPTPRIPEWADGPNHPFRRKGGSIGALEPAPGHI